MSKTITIPTVSFKSIRSAVSSALHTAGDVVLNAKTPSLKEIGEAANSAQKTVRHAAAEVIDSKVDKP